MMHLHKDKENFLEVITATSEYFTIPEIQVEKDYYVSYLLEHLVKVSPQIVFKGGTSLSKCYGIIKRFSEDIDINHAANKKPTQSEKREFKKSIITAINNAQLEHLNPKDIQSRRDHNNYEVGFPQITDQMDAIKSHLLVETFIPIKTFPTEQKKVSSYILDFLEKVNEVDIINAYQLQPFLIHVQRIDRTFIDKLFAICDYYEHKTVSRHSRHLYDLHKIFESIDINKKDFQDLFELVKIERQRRPNINVSSRSDYNLKETIDFILANDVYLDDYEDVTKTLLFEKVSYKSVKDSIYKLLDQEVIPK